jgi:hypothetical protein
MSYYTKAKSFKEKGQLKSIELLMEHLKAWRKFFLMIVHLIDVWSLKLLRYSSSCTKFQNILKRKDNQWQAREVVGISLDFK